MNSTETTMTVIKIPIMTMTVDIRVFCGRRASLGRNGRPYFE